MIAPAMPPTRSIFLKEEAEQMLPLVEAIMKDVVKDFAMLSSLGKERARLERADKPVEEIRSRIAHLSMRVERYLEELAELGCEIRDLELGIVDFPTYLDAEPAYFCWRLGDPLKILYFHPAEKGYAEKERL